VDITHGRILYLEDVSVSFDGFKAINKLSLDIAPGELRCIIGPNGAGKTTMMDIITGKTRPTKARCFLAAPLICCATRSRNCPDGHWPQVPEAHGV
jgi:urea transport system ATP-binding protein